MTEYELLPVDITRKEIKTCPCCDAKEIKNRTINGVNIATYACDTIVILPDRAVIHLGRKCKRNMINQKDSLPGLEILIPTR